MITLYTFGPYFGLPGWQSFRYQSHAALEVRWS